MWYPVGACGRACVYYLGSKTVLLVVQAGEHSFPFSFLPAVLLSAGRKAGVCDTRWWLTLKILLNILIFFLVPQDFRSLEGSGQIVHSSTIIISANLLTHALQPHSHATKPSACRTMAMCTIRINRRRFTVLNKIEQSRREGTRAVHASSACRIAEKCSQVEFYRSPSISLQDDTFHSPRVHAKSMAAMYHSAEEHPSRRDLCWHSLTPRLKQVRSKIDIRGRSCQQSDACVLGLRYEYRISK